MYYSETEARKIVIEAGLKLVEKDCPHPIL